MLLKAERGPLHIHVHPDHPLFLRQGHACLHGVIEQVADDAAQVQLRHFQLHRDVSVHLRRDVPGTRKGNFAVENGVGHGVATGCNLADG